MAKQAERREATKAAIVAAAGDLFAAQGFADTTVDQIAASAGVAKGAVYHHFPTKEAVFEAVFLATSVALAARVGGASKRAADVLDILVEGTRAYFAACAEPATGRIMLKDGPAVLGWERWREIDAEHFMSKMPDLLDAAMRKGLIAKQPAAPLARLLVGAVTEAAVACAAAEDPVATGRAHVRALETLLAGLRLKP